MKLDQNNNLIAPLKVIDVDGNTVGEALKASEAFALLEFAWNLDTVSPRVLSWANGRVSCVGVMSGSTTVRYCRF